MDTRMEFDAGSLFGNEAAEDEDEGAFISHLLIRNDLGEFNSPSNPIKIVRAYKGEGKSSLLRSLATALATKSEHFVVRTTGGAVFPEIVGHDPAKWARAWKKELYKLIAVKVGSNIGHAWNDDTISLLEEAEKEGFRRRNFISTIADRLLKGSAAIGIERNRIEGQNFGPIVARYIGGEIDHIWLIIDDIDRNFRDTKADKAKIVGFFDAIRDMRNAIPQLRIRTSIRPNVYASVKLEFESISHVWQYLMTLSWTEEQIRQMLARRIEGYLTRTGKIEGMQIPPAGKARDLFYIAMIFESPMPWAGGARPAHIPLYTLSAHRPRWLIELCKISADRAFKRHAWKISLDDIREEMSDFGERRKGDLVAEFRPQCAQLEDMVDAFHLQREIYTTEELYALIEERILAKFSPNIAGLSGRARAEDVASFLFEVGLFFGRRQTDAGYEHVSFAQKPSMFRSAHGPEPGIRWEIHPAFRTALGIRGEFYQG